MWSQFMGALEYEMKEHPRIILLMVLTAMGILGYSYATFAEKMDVDQKVDSLETRLDQQSVDLKNALKDVNLRLTTIEWTQEQRFLEQRLATIESEIYQLERLVAKGDETPRDQQRLDALKIEFNQMTRTLDSQRRQTEARLRQLQ